MRIKDLSGGLFDPSFFFRMDYISLLKGEGLTPHQGAIAFKDPDGAQKPFAPHYDQHIRPLVQRFEESRIEALEKVRTWSLKLLPVAVLAIIMAIGAITMLDLSGDGQKTVMVLLLITLAAIAFVIHIPIGSYKSDVKSRVFPKIFSFFGDYAYNKNGMSSVDILKSSDIIPSYNRQSTEDYIKGEYKGISIELTEAHLETEHKDSKGNTRTKTVFKGIFILLSMHKNFKGKTIIKRDKGAIRNWFGKKFSSLENVQLEDPVFEKQFEVYSNDQIEARYLLTTSFMERLLELTTAFGEKGIQASFYDDKLLMMIPSGKNRFETASIFIPATFEEEINTILTEMDEIFQIVNMLKLNQNIGL